MENIIRISKDTLNDNILVRKVGVLTLCLGTGLIAISFINPTNIPNTSIKQ